MAAPPEISADDLDEQEDTVPGARRGAPVSINPFTMVNIDADLRPAGASRITIAR